MAGNETRIATQGSPMAELEHGTEVNDLSLLSLLAAHELEGLQRNEPIDGWYLSELRDRLAEQITGPEHEDIKNIAPSTVQLYRRAVCAATNDDPADFPALVQAITSLLEQLTLASQAAPADAPGRNLIGDLNPLLAFVVALHSQLLAQKQRARSGRSTSRYRV